MVIIEEMIEWRYDEKLTVVEVGRASILYLIWYWSAIYA
jgi:hypothetical protein